MTYISNAVSLQMLSGSCRMNCERLESAPDLTGAVSVVGHADIARLVGVPYNRQSVRLEVGDVCLVAQVTGGRLPEGCTELPVGVRLEWWRLTIE